MHRILGMERVAGLLAVAVIALAALAAAQGKKGAAAGSEIKSGPCALKKSDSFGDDALKIEVGKTVQGVCKLYIDEFFEKKIVNANIEVTNTGSKPMHCQYYVAFFDKGGKLIGAAGQGNFGDEGIAPGEKTQLGSCLIPLPLGEHERIASYQIAFYESEGQIGK